VVRRAFGQVVVLTALVLTGSIFAVSAFAEEKTVVVDSHCKPWDLGANPKKPFGISGHNGRPPVYVTDIKLVAGTKLKFSATGTTTTFPGNPPIGAGGDPSFVTDGRYGNPGAFFPSRYFDKAAYPAFLNALVGAFVDADGVVIGDPFQIGAHAVVTIPKGASGVALGLNDDNLNDNSGSLSVVIDYIVPTVTGEEVGG
jgi:hypothetical protein